jgi:hypothetical protein
MAYASIRTSFFSFSFLSLSFAFSFPHKIPNAVAAAAAAAAAAYHTWPSTRRSSTKNRKRNLEKTRIFAKSSAKR